MGDVCLQGGSALPPPPTREQMTDATSIRQTLLKTLPSLAIVISSMVVSRLKVQKLRDQSEASVQSGYGLGMHWVHSYTAWDIMGVYARCTELVWSGYGLKGGDENIGLNRCRINF